MCNIKLVPQREDSATVWTVHMARIGTVLYGAASWEPGVIEDNLLGEFVRFVPLELNGKSL